MVFNVRPEMVGDALNTFILGDCVEVDPVGKVGKIFLFTKNQ